MKIEGVNKITGEIVKPYETPEHLKIKDVIKQQIEFVNRNIKDARGEKISRLNGDNLSKVLMELTAMYETLSMWLADEKLHIADLKTANELKFANEYVSYKNQEGETSLCGRHEAVRPT